MFERKGFFLDNADDLKNKAIFFLVALVVFFGLSGLCFFRSRTSEDSLNNTYFNPRMFWAQEAMVMSSNTPQTDRRFYPPPFASLTTAWFRPQLRVVNQTEATQNSVSIIRKAERVQNKLQEKYAFYNIKTNVSESGELNLYNTTIPYHKRDVLKRDFRNLCNEDNLPYESSGEFDHSTYASVVKKGGFSSNQTWAVYRQKTLHSLITKKEEVLWGKNFGYSSKSKNLIEWFDYLRETKKKTVDQIVLENPIFLTSTGVVEDEITASMEFSNKKDKEFFNNSKTLIQKDLLTPVTDFNEITKQAADFFYSFTRKLMTTEGALFSSEDFLSQVDKCKEIDRFYYSLEFHFKNHPVEYKIIREYYRFYKIQGHAAIQAYNESTKPITSKLVNQWGHPLVPDKPELKPNPISLEELADENDNESNAEPIISSVVKQWGDPLPLVKPELASNPLSLEELADKKARPVFKLENRKKANQYLKVNRTTKMKNYGSRNRGK